MDALVNWLRNIASWVVPPKPVGVIDIVQILLLAWVVYKLIVWMKDTRAYTLLKGILFIVAFVVVANLLEMEVIVWMINNLSVVAITALVIIFQPELRRILERMGHSNLFSSLLFSGRSGEENKRFSDQTINELVRAAFDMGEERTGALIVVEKDVRLEEYVNTGIPIDAVVSSQLLINIFEKNTPLHDGAVIVRGNRIVAATCYLPLSDNMDVSKKLGTRHRAGIGISEVSDSLTIIVSEETGNVSYTQNGKLRRAVTPSELREVLTEEQPLVKSRKKNRMKGGAA